MLFHVPITFHITRERIDHQYYLGGFAEEQQRSPFQYFAARCDCPKYR